MAGMVDAHQRGVYRCKCCCASADRLLIYRLTPKCRAYRRLTANRRRDHAESIPKERSVQTAERVGTHLLPWIVILNACCLLRGRWHARTLLNPAVSKWNFRDNMKISSSDDVLFMNSWISEIFALFVVRLSICARWPWNYSDPTLYSAARDHVSTSYKYWHTEGCIPRFSSLPCLLSAMAQERSSQSASSSYAKPHVSTQEAVTFNEYHSQPRAEEGWWKYRYTS